MDLKVCTQKQNLVQIVTSVIANICNVCNPFLRPNYWIAILILSVVNETFNVANCLFFAFIVVVYSTVNLETNQKM